MEGSAQREERELTVAIKKTGESRYQIQWYDASGHFRKRTIRGDKEQAIREERQILARRDRGEETTDPRRAPSFKDAAAVWQTATGVRQKESTRTQWESILSNHLIPRWGERRVSTLTEQDALELQQHLQDTVKLSPARSNLVLGAAKAILQLSVRTVPRAARTCLSSCKQVEAKPRSFGLFSLGTGH